SPADAFAGQLAKPPLHQVQPTRTGRDKMRNETVMPFKPALHTGMFVRAIIIHHHVQLDPAGKLRIQALEKLQELLVAMASVTLTDDLALRHFQRGKERGRPVALVIVGHRSAPTLLEGQPRSGPMQGPNL